MILAYTGDELWCGQGQNWVNLDFKLNLILKVNGRSLHKTIGTLTKMFCTFGPNLVIQAWTGPELSRGQKKWLTHRLTDTQKQATTIPEGQNWPRVKIWTLSKRVKCSVQHPEMCRWTWARCTIHGYVKHDNCESMGLKYQWDHMGIRASQICRLTVRVIAGSGG